MLRISHLLAIALAALLEYANVARPAFPPQQRRYISLPIRVDTLRDGARDDTLARPLLLTADDQRIYWFDYGDGRLSAMDTTGRLLWRAGRRGQGPGEFANPTSLLAVRGGGVVVDGGAARFARIDAAGRFARLVSSVDIPQRLARGPGTTLIAFGGQNGRPTATQLDSAFAPTARIFPLRTGTLALNSGVDGLDARPLPPRVPLAGDNGLVVAGFPQGTKPAIRDAAIVGEYLFVIPAGDAFEGRTLDVYHAATGRYRASLRLPIGVNALAGRAAELVAVSLDDHAAIVRIRWDAAALAGAVR